LRAVLLRFLKPQVKFEEKMSRKNARKKEKKEERRRRKKKMRRKIKPQTKMLATALLEIGLNRSLIPLAQTFSSQKFMYSVMLNCTMTYLAGGRLASLQFRFTVAAAGTAPGY